MAMNENFAVLILSHGRPDHVYTYATLRKHGYTGDIYIVIDNEDDCADQYREKYGGYVVMFDKEAVAETFDEADNFGDRRAVVYARNASWAIARDLGLSYFMQLDDDYIDFRYKMDGDRGYTDRGIKSLDSIIGFMLAFYKTLSAQSIAMAQTGDFIGAAGNEMHSSVTTRRKCMNTFICSVERPFQFVGRINEDVNAYTWFQSLGNWFLTIPLICIQQKRTQSNPGGMSEMYLESGTYIKSFYTVIFQPSSVKIVLMQSKHPRLHHQVRWENTVPYILAETWRK
jgi:hypothetical protein